MKNKQVNYGKNVTIVAKKSNPVRPKSIRKTA